jgi:zinc protease
MRGALKKAFLAAVFVCALAAPATAIEIKQVRSSAGINAWLVEDRTNPIITLSFAWRGGAALDPSGKEGLANLVASSLDEGAGDLDSQAFQGKVEDLAAQISFRAGMESFSGSFAALSETQDEAFDLLRLAINKPRFDDAAVNRMRLQIASGLRRETENPRGLAARELMAQLFPSHPYRRDVQGTLETVPVIKIADMRQFMTERLARDNLIVAAVGDITPDQLARRLDQLFGALPMKAKPWLLARPTPAAADRVIVIERAVPQSVIRWGQAGILRKDPNFFAAYIMNHILGGAGFESRLMSEVREKRGLAYSTSSSLATMDQAGLLMGAADTRNDSAAKTIEVVRAEWQRMHDIGVTQDELNDAKTYITGSYALQFSSSSAISGVLLGIQLEELGIDYINRRDKLISAVTANDVNKVAKSLLSPDKLTVVVVGKPDGVVPKP